MVLSLLGEINNGPMSHRRTRAHIQKSPVCTYAAATQTQCAVWVVCVCVWCVMCVCVCASGGLCVCVCMWVYGRVSTRLFVWANADKAGKARSARHNVTTCYSPQIARVQMDVGRPVGGGETDGWEGGGVGTLDCLQAAGGLTRVFAFFMPPMQCFFA